MIKIIEGNLLDAKENIIVHQVNCQRKMGSGIAKQIRDKWTNVYSSYMNLTNDTISSTGGTKELLGRCQLVKIEDYKFVANIFSQYNYGYDGSRYTDYEAIYRGLETLSKVAKEEIFTVAIPYNLGSDRGGANWRIVYTMIEELFKDIDVTIYKYNGGK